MSEGSHDWSDGKCVADLVDCSKPGPDIRDVPRSREAEDVVKKVLSWFDPIIGDKKPKEIYVSRSKLKLFRVECTASPSSCLQELTNTEEVLLDTVVVQHGVVHAGLLVVLKALHHLGLPLSVGISSTDQALWAGLVPVAAPGSDEGGEVTVSWVEGHTVVTVPTVHHRLDLVGRDGGHDGPGRLRVVGLARSVLVQVGVVHHPPGRAISLRCDNHAA